MYSSGSCWVLTSMGDGEAVGRLEVIYVIVQMERLLGRVLVGVVELHGKPKSAVLLYCRPHEEPTLGGKGEQEEENWWKNVILDLPIKKTCI